MPIQSHDSVLNQSYGSVPTQSYDTAPTQSYGNAPTQMVQNLGNFPVPQTFNAKVDQINRINEPNQAINAINTNSNQFTERNDTPKADSNQNFDQLQSHEANYGTNH